MSEVRLVWDSICSKFVRPNTDHCLEVLNKLEVTKRKMSLRLTRIWFCQEVDVFMVIVNMATRHLKRAIYLYKSLKIQVRVFYWQFSLLSRSSLEARHVIFLPRERLLNQMTICPITAHFPIKVANVGPREILHEISTDTIVTFQQVC